MQIFKPSLKRRMQEEIETEPVGMRDVERQRERTRRGRKTGRERERERDVKRKRERVTKGKRERETERDSWLHHISLAVVECALRSTLYRWWCNIGEGVVRPRDRPRAPC